MFNQVLVHLSPAVIFLLSCFAALCTSMILTGLVERLACRYGWVRQPTSARHVHTRATPRLGGVAIYLTTVGLLALGILLSGPKGATSQAMHSLERVLLPASMLFFVGVLDDYKPLPARLKLGCQIGSGIWLYLLGYSVFGPVQHDAHALLLHLSLLNGAELAATTIWVVWITNAINLIDGLDGLAAGSSLFSMATLFIAAYLHGSHSTALGTALLGGAVIGFLRHNFNPASIFLGDGGSLFIGFMLSALGLMDSSQTRMSLGMTIALPALAFGLPLLEVVLSVSRRFLSGKRLFEPDRMHIHHRLLDLGLSHRQAVLVLWAASGTFGLLALILVYPTWLGLLCSCTLLALLGSAGIIKLGYVEFGELARILKRTLQQRRVIANAVLVNRAVAMLQEASSMDAVRAALEHCFPAACSAEIRLALASRDGSGPAHLFRIRAVEGPHTSDGFTSLPVSLCERSARLVMELELPDYRGTLEFVLAVSAQETILNVHQLSAKLHPALDVALNRLLTSAPALPVLTDRQQQARSEASLPAFSLGEGAALTSLQYVQ